MVQSTVQVWFFKKGKSYSELCNASPESAYQGSTSIVDERVSFILLHMRLFSYGPFLLVFASWRMGVAFFPHLSKVLGEGLRSVFRFAEGDAVEVVGDVRRAAAELGRSHRHAFSCFPIDGMDAWQVEARARSHEQDQRAGHDPSIVPTHVSAVLSASPFHSFSFPPFLSRIVGAARAHVLPFFWEAFRNVRRVVSNLVDCFLWSHHRRVPSNRKGSHRRRTCPSKGRRTDPVHGKTREGAAGKRMSSTTGCGCGGNGGGSHVPLVPCRATHGGRRTNPGREKDGVHNSNMHMQVSIVKGVRGKSKATCMPWGAGGGTMGTETIQWEKRKERNIVSKHRQLWQKN